MATLDPLATYDTASAASMVGVSETFLLKMISRAIQQKVIQPLKDWKIAGSDLTKLGKTYWSAFQSEQSHQAFLRVRERELERLFAE